MTVIATFRDLNDADRFVWLRGFPDMAAREEALKTFYGGPLWKANRDAANATLVDSDNVLLLRAARPASGFAWDDARGGLIAAMVYAVGAEGSQAFTELFERTLQPALVNAGSTLLATFVTEHAEEHVSKSSVPRRRRRLRLVRPLRRPCVLRAVSGGESIVAAAAIGSVAARADRRVSRPVKASAMKNFWLCLLVAAVLPLPAGRAIRAARRQSRFRFRVRRMENASAASRASAQRIYDVERLLGNVGRL